MSAIIGYRKPSPGSQPPNQSETYGSARKRAPREPAIALPATLSEVTGPSFEGVALPAHAADLTAGHPGQPLGERMIVRGRVLDDGGKPVPNALVEIWQCNAAGRYMHVQDQHDAPLDPNFRGAGCALTDAEGRYAFKTIRPGAYPWRNHFNAWRPGHIHFSLFGAGLGTRLVTQMYFPGDPLLEFDPIYHSVPDAGARARLVAALDWESAVSEHALGYRFDIVLRGRLETPWEVGA
jgi:protocatechuate 3,4-dioxygenase, beta subunit